MSATEALQKAADQVRKMIGAKGKANVAGAKGAPARGQFAKPGAGARPKTQEKLDPDSVEGQLAKMASLGSTRSMI